MNIGLDATYSLGGNLSGVGIYCREIIHGLAAAHPETTFDLCYRSHRILRSLTVPLPANCRRRLLRESGVRGLHLFHGLNQRLPASRAASTVSTFHDLFVMTGDYSSPEFRERFTRLARDAAARSDRIIAVSAFTAAQVGQLLGVEAARIRVVRHGVRPPPVRDAARPAREKIILHVGAVQKRKNLVRLVEAFERTAAGWRLVLAGSLGYGAAAVLERIGHSPRRDAIELAGYLDDRQRDSLYARASLFAFPSLDEGFGLPVLEAMAWGVPVIASNRAALPEVCGDAALLVDPEDTDALAAALDGLMRDSSRREDLARRGHTRSLQFTWEKAAEETWEVYRELAPR